MQRIKMLSITSPLLFALVGVEAAPAYGQDVSPEIRREVRDLLGFDPFTHLDPTPALDADVYALRKEDLVRTDNPAVKREVRPERILDPPPVIDKRDFRTPHSDAYALDEIYVRFKPGVGAGAAQLTHQQLGATVVWRSAMVPGLCKVRIAANTDVLTSVNDYLDAADVLYAEPDYQHKRSDGSFNDPMQVDLWGVSTGPGGSWACDAWGQGIGGGALMAIIDTGTDTDHPDLAANIWFNPGEIPGNGVDDDNNGYVDDINGWNVRLESPNVEPCGSDHGTHVAGTAGARGNNGIGMLGVAPFGTMMILACNGPNGDGSDPCAGLYDTTQGLDYAIANGARVSNASYVGGFCQTAYDVILAGQAVDHIHVAAAGNESEDADVIPLYPAAYGLGNVISVAAINQSGGLASFSNYGDVSVDLGAPGMSILSTVNGGGYEGSWQGTSMAAPHVTGAVALVMGSNPDLDWSQIRARLLQSVDPLPSLAGKTVTGGKLNVFRAYGVWVEPGWNGQQVGSYFKPFNETNTLTAYTQTPEYGTLNFFGGGVIPAAHSSGLWSKPMTLEVREGAVTLGQ